MTFHDMAKRRTRENRSEMFYFHSLAEVTSMKLKEAEAEFERISREGGIPPARLAHNIDKLRIELASYTDAAKSYRTNVKLGIANLFDQYLPMAKVNSYRSGAVDSWQFKRAMDNYRHWGTEFAQILRDEDDQEFASLLNRIYSAGYATTARAMEAMKDKYQDCTGTEMWRCDCCGDHYSDSDGQTEVHCYDDDTEAWCDSCLDEATHSEIMDAYIRDGHAYDLYTDVDDFENSNRNDVITERFARRSRRGRFFLITHPHSGDNCYVDEDVYAHWQEEHNNDESSLWHTYHSGVRIGHIPSQADHMKQPVYMGVEVEIEFTYEDSEDEVDSEDRQNRRKFAKAFRKHGPLTQYAVLERDGSLTCGLEAITGYTGLDVHREMLPELCRIANYHGGHPMETTGFHVHVSKAGMTPLHLAKLSELIYKAKNRVWIETIAGRDFGNYREAIDHKHQIRVMTDRTRQLKREGYGYSKADKMKYIMDGMGYDLTRYAALSFNTSTRETIEFRMFAGSLEPDRLMAYIEFAHACWHFSQQQPMRCMTPQDFAKFICRADQRASTKALRKYMKTIDEHVVTEEARYVRPVTGNANKKLKKAVAA